MSKPMTLDELDKPDSVEIPCEGLEVETSNIVIPNTNAFKTLTELHNLSVNLSAKTPERYGILMSAGMELLKEKGINERERERRAFENLKWNTNHSDYNATEEKDNTNLTPTDSITGWLVNGYTMAKEKKWDCYTKRNNYGISVTKLMEKLNNVTKEMILGYMDKYDKQPIRSNRDGSYVLEVNGEYLNVYWFKEG